MTRTPRPHAAVNKEWADGALVLKPVARIEQWCEWNNRLIGSVSRHPNQDSFLRPTQITSEIVARGDGWVETENTRYILGEPECHG